MLSATPFYPTNAKGPLSRSSQMTEGNVISSKACSETRRLSKHDSVTSLTCLSGKWCPEENANLWSRFFFTYVDSILRMGFRKPLHQEDLWDLAARDEAPQLSAQFSDCLNSDPHKGSVVRTMWQCFGGPFVRAGLMKFVHDIVMFTGVISHAIMKGGRKIFSVLRQNCRRMHQRITRSSPLEHFIIRLQL